MRKIKIFSGLSHAHVETEVNKWMETNSVFSILSINQSERTGEKVRAFTLTIFYDDNDKKHIRAAIPINVD